MADSGFAYHSVIFILFVFLLLNSLMNNDRTPLIRTFVEKNAQLNLSAIRDEEGILVKHIQDSLEVNKILTFPP